MKILALDLATKTGWACSDGTSGVHQFQWTGKTAGDRWDDFVLWIGSMLDLYAPTHVVYEAALHQKGMAARVANSLVTIIEHECWKRGLEDRGYHLSTIKKHATGSGRADKVQMYEAALKRNPDRKYLSDDEVDALWLLDLAISELAPSPAE